MALQNMIAQDRKTADFESDDWMEKFNRLTQSICEKREEAISARAASGIEKQWEEDQNHIDGFDEQNPRKNGSWLDGTRPPQSPDSSFTRINNGGNSGIKSTVFLKITAPYVASASARIADMTISSDERNFSIKQTPIPSNEELENQTPISNSPQNIFLLGANENPNPQSNPNPQNQEIPLNISGSLESSPEIEKATNQIDDWLVECNWQSAYRQVIECCAGLGVGILKGPFPKLIKTKSAKKDDMGWRIQINEEVAPFSQKISPWNFYPDPSCGESIQDGEYVFEKSMISGRRLRELAEQDGYFSEMIVACIDEGAKSKDGAKPKEKRNQYEMWTYYGFIGREEMEMLGCSCETITDNLKQVPCVLVMVNDHIIKAALSPLDSGEFPFDVVVWQEIPEFWAGVGIARQMRECQEGANQAVRRMHDNAGLASGPQIVIDRSAIEPADGEWCLTPNKIWWSKKDAGVIDMKQAMQIQVIPMLQVEILNILNFWLARAEQATNLPMLLQGQQGAATQTVGGMTILQNNGASVLRRVVKRFDDMIVEPHIRRYYEYLLMHGPDDAKGDMQVDARGSSTMIERDLQAQTMQQMLQVAANPAYGIDPKKLMEEFLRSMRFDPNKLLYTEQEKQAMAQQAPPPDPRIQVAQIHSQDKEKEMMAEANAQQLEIAAQAQEKEKDRALEIQLKEMDDNSGQVGLGVGHQNILMQNKTKLAETAMEIQAQKELSQIASAQNSATPNVISPPNEPIGKAKSGEGFQS